MVRATLVFLSFVKYSVFKLIWVWSTSSAPFHDAKVAFHDTKVKLFTARK